MQNQSNSISANAHWEEAANAEKKLKLEIEPELNMLELVSNAQSRRFRWAYLSSAPLEFLVYAVFLLPLIEASLKQLYQTDHWGIRFVAFLILPLVVVVLHSLVSQSALFLGMAGTTEKWTEEYLQRSKRRKSLLGLAFISEQPSLFYKRAFIAMTFIVFTGLAYARGLVLNGYHHINDQNWGSYLAVELISLVLLAIMLFFVSSFNIEWRRWYLLGQSRDLSTKRDQELKSFRKDALIVENEQEKASDYFRRSTAGEEDRICLRRLKSLREDAGDFQCLVPLQRLDVEAYYEKMPVPGLQVRALTIAQTPLTTRTDVQGKAQLQWHAYSRELELLAVGDKIMYNVCVPQAPQVVELTTGIDPDRPSLHSAA